MFGTAGSARGSGLKICKDYSWFAFFYFFLSYFREVFIIVLVIILNQSVKFTSEKMHKMLVEMNV